VYDPFANLSATEWSNKRDELIDEYPLDITEIRDLVLRSYNKLLQTRIGEPSDDILIFEDVPVGAQTTGAFLETIIANEIQKRDSAWRQGSDGEKDLIHTDNTKYSTEIKMSGQVNDKVFGNRSFAQDSGSNGKKSKSGFYITLNVHISEEILSASHNLFLIRFGWIDFDDWTGQSAATGQAATLPSEVYEHKLRVVDGDYLLDAPLELVHMIGPSTIEDIQDFIDRHEILTIGEFVDTYNSTDDPDSTLEKVYRKAKKYPQNTLTMKNNNLTIDDLITETDP